VDLNPRNALDRTALLLNDDLFGGELDLDEVVDGLCSTTVRVVADAVELESVAAQHALTTLVLHLAMCGIGMKLDIPNVPLLGKQPPLVGDDLKQSIIDHLGTTMPWIAVDRDGPPALTFSLGATEAASDTIIVAGTSTSCRVGPRSHVTPVSWAGTWPVGPIAAGIAAGAEAVRAAVLLIARRSGATVAPILAPGTLTTAIEVGPSPLRAPDVGTVPIISAGAITHAALFVLLRVEELVGTSLVFDDDRCDVSNLNRYELMEARDLGHLKSSQLERWSSSDFQIRGISDRYRAGDAEQAERMLIGADDIAIRWDAQRDAPRWLGIGATSHLFAEVSTHTFDTPCAGCVHDHEDDVPGVIPTISVVSGWDGLVLASELLRSAADVAGGRRTWSFPLGLAGRHGHASMPTVPNLRCPIGCDAAMSLRSQSA
jgi:hypothetical protein